MRHVINLLLFTLAACAAPRASLSRPSIPVDSSVQLAADVVLPLNRPSGGVPTILIQTRYWRSFRLIGGGGPVPPQGPREPIVDRLVAAGFGVVITDVRGTGASDGSWRWPWSTAEVRDMRAVIDWIVAQPWSNGTVGATGVSYEGTTALLTAAVRHPALKAVLARQIEWELADETLAPGGVRNALFPEVWGRTVDALDHGRYPEVFPRFGKFFIRGVARRGDDRDGTMQAQRERARASSDISERVRHVYAGRDPFGANGPPVDSIGPAGHATALGATRAVVAIWGSWWDGGTADAVFRADSVMPLAQAVIGGWTHEGDRSASPLPQRGNVQHTVDLESVVAFFQRTVREDAAPLDSTQRVRWYTAGSGQWRTASTWPSTTPRAWSMREANTPTRAGAIDTWIAHGKATTGTNTRWTTGLVRPVDVRERASATGVFTYVLPPLVDSLHVFGAGAFTCAMHADVPEATLHVYVESVDPSGRVRLLTEGMQRVVRKLGPVPPEESVTIRIRPVAFALPPQWRLRVALAGEDVPTFERVPASGDVTWRVDPSRCVLTLPTERTP